LVGCLACVWVARTASSRCVRISGMTCSVLPLRDSQPHSQLARRWPLLAGAAGLTVTLCPATCSLTEMVMVTSDRSGMAELTRLGSRSPNSPLGSGRRSVAVAWSRRDRCRSWSQRSPVCAGRAGEPQRGPPPLPATSQARPGARACVPTPGRAVVLGGRRGRRGPKVCQDRGAGVDRVKRSVQRGRPCPRAVGFRRRFAPLGGVWHDRAP